MPRFHYGRTSFEWRFQPDARLKRHYVTVERDRPVLLRGPLASPAEQETLIRQRARWIRDRLAQVKLAAQSDAIVTGSRLRYAGRSYFTELRQAADADIPRLSFTASRFVIDHRDGSGMAPEVAAALLERFYHDRAHDKLPARVRHWERQTGLQAHAVRIRHFQRRWACCNAHNVLEFHPRVMELAASVLDYVIVHELCHTVEKNHTRAFWSLVARHMPDWARQHALLERAAFDGVI